MSFEQAVKNIKVFFINLFCHSQLQPKLGEYNVILGTGSFGTVIDQNNNDVQHDVYLNACRPKATKVLMIQCSVMLEFEISPFYVLNPN